MAEEDDDKQYDPTPRKLEEARKKGEIAKSTDLIASGAYLGFFICAMAFGGEILIGFGRFMMNILAGADQTAVATFSGSQTPYMGAVLRESIVYAFPWFALPMTMAILMILVQRAFVFSGQKVELKLSRISILEGFKNKFGRQGLFEFLKSFVKLLLLSVLLGIFLYYQSERIVASAVLSPQQVIIELNELVIILIAIIVAISISIGLVDYIWQYGQHIRKNRMSRKEIMDELKQSEGDPYVKQQRRQKGIDIALNGMLADVPDADVVIVNPTHYAIALKWSRLPGDAPVCTAKGVDEIAARIREIAIENSVPIHSDPPTARAVYASVNIGEEISPEYYQPVAAAIRFAESVRKRFFRK